MYRQAGVIEQAVLARLPKDTRRLPPGRPGGREDGARVLRTTRDIILLATDTALTRDALEQRIRDRVGGRVTVNGFKRFGGDLYTGLVSLADAPLLTDAYAPVDSLIEVD